VEEDLTVQKENRIKRIAIEKIKGAIRMLVKDVR
jgi:hypothetical protein